VQELRKRLRRKGGRYYQMWNVVAAMWRRGLVACSVAMDAGVKLIWALSRQGVYHAQQQQQKRWVVVGFLAGQLLLGMSLKEQWSNALRG
jgi:hypothetical protein